MVGENWEIDKEGASVSSPVDDSAADVSPADGVSAVGPFVPLVLVTIPRVPLPLVSRPLKVHPSLVTDARVIGRLADDMISQLYVGSYYHLVIL